MDSYKKCIIKINELLSKHEKEALVSREKVRKAENGLQDMMAKLSTLDQELEGQEGQIKMLLTLE